MISVETKVVDISLVILNPDNPRTITEKDMARLVKSLADFPEMLNIREIVVDETMTALGGNMRLSALRLAGAKECTVKIVTGLSDDQKREFCIKDNGTTWGQWDYDVLANEWDGLPLSEWGVKFAIGDDPNNEWDGMPEFSQEDLLAKHSVKINFLNEKDVKVFSLLIGQKITDKTKSIWFPEHKIESRTGEHFINES